MKRKLLYFCGVCLLLLALVGCSSASKAASLEFIPYEHEDGVFYAEFPVTPEAYTETSPSPVGDIQFNMYMSEVENALFLVTFNDYPDAVMEVMDSASLLNKGASDAVAAIDGTLIEEKDYTFEGYPGKEVKYSGSRDGLELTIYHKVFLVDNRLFQLQIINADTDEYLDHYDDFFNSFKLSK